MRIMFLTVYDFQIPLMMPYIIKRKTSYFQCLIYMDAFKTKFSYTEKIV